jgi:hypothetical protein
MWPTLPTEEALKMQKPLSEGTLTIVARGEKEDRAVSEAKDSEELLL